MRTTLIAATTAAIFAPFVALAADYTVFFDFDSARLTQEGRSVVQQAANDYASTGETSVSVVGHTDTSGSAAYNIGLSERRARTVTEALVALGVPTSAMTVGWRGEAEPAVGTGDGVREAANRRVEIAIAQPSVSAPMMQPTVEEVVSGLRFGVGPFVGYNMENGDESIMTGLNFTAAYDVTPNVSLTAEQAAFYNFDARDEGWGGRSALGAEFALNPTGGVQPFLGAQGGYMYIDGSGTGGWFAGPKAGVRVGDFELKAGYDFLEDRDWEDGVVSLTAGYNLRF